MGNWRTVNIVGHCSEEDVAALGEALKPGKDYKNFHCLVIGGVCGLPNWADVTINATGNLAERDYTVDEVREQLERLAKVAPSLAVKVHCGNDHESTECINTITLEDGKATVGDPEILEIEPISDE